MEGDTLKLRRNDLAARGASQKSKLRVTGLRFLKWLHDALHNTTWTFVACRFEWCKTSSVWGILSNEAIQTGECFRKPCPDDRTSLLNGQGTIMLRGIQEMWPSPAQLGKQGWTRTLPTTRPARPFGVRSGFFSFFLGKKENFAHFQVCCLFLVCLFGVFFPSSCFTFYPWLLSCYKFFPFVSSPWLPFSHKRSGKNKRKKKK